MSVVQVPVEWEVSSNDKSQAKFDVVSIYVSAGQDVMKDDDIAEIENDKAVEAVPAPVSGKILEIFLTPGQEQLPYGTILCTIEEK